jgi:RNA polymerase sigma factor (sigma-70 family)
MINKDELNYLFKYALALCHNETKAYDLVQEGMARYLASGKEVIPPIPYIKRIIRNYFIDQVRKNIRHKEVEIEESVVSLDESFELKIENKDILEKILEICHDEEREILFLWAYDGMSFSEISKELNIPKGTILSKFHRLKNKIKNKYREVDHG